MNPTVTLLLYRAAVTAHLKEMNKGFAMTPLDIFREYILKHVFRELATKKRGM